MKRLLALTLLFALALPAQAMTTPVLVMNRPGSGYSASAVRYLGIMGFGSGALGSANSAEAPMPIAGTFSKLYFRAPAALAAGTSYTIVLMKNNAATSLTAQITDAGLVASDLVNTVTVAAGDEMALRITPAGTPTSQTALQADLVFDADTSGESFILTLGSGPSAASTMYAPLGHYNAFGATENLSSVVFPTAGVIDNLYVDIATAPGSGKSQTITLVKNGTPTSQTCTVSGTATTCTDLTNAVTVAAGDTLSIQQTPTGTPALAAIRLGQRFVPTTSGESVMLAQAANPAATANRYLYSTGDAANISDETAAYTVAPIDFTWKKLYLDYNVAPGSGKSRSVTARIGGASQSLTASVADTNTTANDTSNTVSVAAGDIINWVTTPVSTPTAPTVMRVSAVMYIDPGTPAASVDNGIVGLVWSLIF